MNWLIRYLPKRRKFIYVHDIERDTYHKLHKDPIEACESLDLVELSAYSIGDKLFFSKELSRENTLDVLLTQHHNRQQSALHNWEIPENAHPH